MKGYKPRKAVAIDYKAWKLRRDVDQLIALIVLCALLYIGIGSIL